MMYLKTGTVRLGFVYRTAANGRIKYCDTEMKTEG